MIDDVLFDVVDEFKRNEREEREEKKDGGPACCDIIERTKTKAEK